MDKRLSVNQLAMRILSKLLENPDFYNVKIEEAKSGVTVVDAGISVEGGLEAGRLITEVCMGGCAKAEITCKKYGELELPSIFVYTDHPVIATLGSQYAGWQIKEEGYSAIGSGPARALALKPEKVFREIAYKDDFSKAVMVLETDKSPPEGLLRRVADACHVSAPDLIVVLTPTASVAGAVQIAGRTIETGIHKLGRLGLNPNMIVHAWGCAPVSPTHPRVADAMARTNDAILYGGTSHYTVRYDDDEKLKEIVQKAPSTASNNYGKPFIEIFKEANGDFYKIDPNLFAPAVVAVDNLKTGKSYVQGKISAKLLSESFSL